MISRPLVAATLAGAFIGDSPSGLLVGAALELIALETLPFGASRYPEWGSAAVVGGAIFAAHPRASAGRDDDRRARGARHDVGRRMDAGEAARSWNALARAAHSAARSSRRARRGDRPAARWADRGSRCAARCSRRSRTRCSAPLADATRRRSGRSTRDSRARSSWRRGERCAAARRGRSSIRRARRALVSSPAASPSDSCSWSLR